MSEIGRKIGKAVVKISSAQDPLFQAVHGEDMPEIVDTGAFPSPQMRNLRLPEHPSKEAIYSCLGIMPAKWRRKEKGVPHLSNIDSFTVFPAAFRKAVRHRYYSLFIKLGIVNVQGTFVEVNILPGQMHRLGNPETTAVEHTQ